jgi:hypothetical protein
MSIFYEISDDPNCIKNPKCLPFAEIVDKAYDPLSRPKKSKVKPKRHYIFLVERDEPTKESKEYTVPEGKKLLPIMMTQKDQEPTRIFVSGTSGSGKSYMTAVLANDFVKTNPKRNIALFSATDYDKNFEGLYKRKKFKKIKLDGGLLEEPIDVEKELADCLVIMDDFEQHSDPLLVDEICRLRKNCLNVGRKHNMFSIVVRQMLLDNNKTKDLHNGVHSHIIFPHSASRFQAQNWLDRYMKMKDAEVQRIMKLPSRWVQIQQATPSFVLHDKGAFLI